MLYLQIGQIPGSCKEEPYGDSIMLDSFSLDVANSLTSNPGNTDRNPGNTDRSSAGAHISDMRCTKTMDVASLPLAAACAGNVNLEEVTLTVTRTDGLVNLELVKYTMTNVLVSSIFTTGTFGGGLPTESFSLNFTAITAEHHKQNPELGDGGVTNFGWDMELRAPK